MSAKARYSLSVWIERPIRDEDDADWMLTPKARRELEREVLQALKKLNGDCDCEVIDTETIVEDEPQTLADRGCDTWAEYRGER